MKQKYLKAIEENDVISVRIFLANELMLDPRGHSFKEMLELAEQKIPTLYELDNGNSYTQDSTTWDEAFLFNLKNDLDENFSREKLYFYETVVKVVLKEKAALLDKEETQQQAASSRQTDLSCNTETGFKHKKAIYAGVTVGGLVLTATGLSLSKVALTSLGIAGVMIGGYLLYKESTK